MTEIPHLGRALITPEMGRHDGEEGPAFACRVHVKMEESGDEWTSPWKLLTAETIEDAYVEGNAQIDLWLMRLNDMGVEFTTIEDNR